MHTTRLTTLAVLATWCLLGVAGPARASAPWSLEELYRQPWPTGNGARHVALSDDGMFLACAWDAESESIYDLWVYDVGGETWTQYTDLWPPREAHLRRQFERELVEAREQWEQEQKQREEGSESDSTAEGDSGEQQGGNGRHRQAFDEEKRREEFEKDLLKQWDTISGISEIVFLSGGHELAYVFEGRVFSLDLDDPEPAPHERLHTEQGSSNLSRVFNSNAILLTTDGDVALWRPADNQLRQLTTGGWSGFDNASIYAITSDLRYLAAVRRDYTAVRKQQMPELLTEDPHMTEHYHVRPQDTPEAVKLVLYDLAGAEPWQIEVELPEEPYYQVEFIDWSPLGDPTLLVGVIDGEGRTYRSYLITPIQNAQPEEDEYRIELAYQEKDDCWINWANTGVRWDNRGGLLLHSEYQGLAGLYRLAERKAETVDESLAISETENEADLDSSIYQPEPLFVGEYEVSRVLPLRHSPLVLLEMLHPDPSYRAIGLFDLDRHELLTTVTGGGLTRWQALSEEEQLLAYTVTTETRNADLHLYRLDGSSAPQLVLDRNSTEWLDWTASWRQQFLQVNGDSGAIPVKLWLPPDWQAGSDYPLLIWLHGSGYAQTVNRDPGFYKLFHPWVAEERGWIVAEVDYRGSKGYGRDWRVDVWGRLGHPEVEDIVAVKNCMVEKFGADAQRTALWGWSYGGFLTLMAMGLAPDEFPVGCAVAPVNRWENYFYWYSTCRLGHPDDYPDNYEQSAAETYLEFVEGDLLIMHGLRDDNTLFQSVAQYLEKGHELGINVELKLFPSDDHGIGNEHHYVRIYQAIIEFCTEHWG